MKWDGMVYGIEPWMALLDAVQHLISAFSRSFAVVNATGAAAAASALLLFTLFLLKLLTRKTDTILYPTLHTQFMFLNPVVSM